MAQVSKTDTRWASRPSPLHHWPRWLLALGLAATAWLLPADAPGEASDWLLVGAAVVGLWTAVSWWFGGQAWVTEEKVVQSRGVVSRHTTEVRIVRVDEVEVKQSGIELLLGIGRLRLRSNDASEQPVTLRGVRHPAEVARLIRDQRAQSDQDKDDL
jgi:uncharacterized membrane protein YdbT with pleckstrin-like domain